MKAQKPAQKVKEEEKKGTSPRNNVVVGKKESNVCIVTINGKDH